MFRYEAFQRDSGGVNRRGRRCGFTLIELLVVVAIISLLVSILMPSLKKARDAARKVVCASNEHGILTAYAMYASEENENIAISKITPANGYRDYISQWLGPARLYKITKHIESPEILYCPDANNARPYSEPFKDWWAWLGGYTTRPYKKGGVRFGFNGTWDTPLNDCILKLLAASSVRSPDSLSVVTDLMYLAEQRTHPDGWNVAWLDGHVTWVADRAGVVEERMLAYPPKESFNNQRSAQWELEKLAGVSVLEY